MFVIKKRGRNTIGALWGLFGLFALTSLANASAPRVDFNRDVRPLLSNNCFACHGFDPKTRMAGLRLDTPEGAMMKLASGFAAVVPGKPEKSSLIQRITMDGPMKMPPASSHKTLTKEQIETLRNWVEQGASYGRHWAFLPPRRVTPPPVQQADWPRNPVDRFLLARMEGEGLKPAPEAGKITLLRRVTFDLTGLPPAPDEVRAFLADDQPGAYERAVDRLLASPHYGERMALQWLDLSRYADTHGYHIDSHRDMWPWRDWVIRAYNQNLPYDQFLTWQLAGDMLPNATMDQKIASGFNRNHPINFEGGAIPEEYQAAYVFDRIDTTTTAFMGLTVKCAQCHDHKYDPVTQNDYYKLYAFFNSIAEQGLDGQKGNANPMMKVPTPEQTQKLEELNAKLAEAENALKARVAEAGPAQAEWEKTTLAALAKETPQTAGLVAHYPLDDKSGEAAKDAAGKGSGAVKGKAAWKDGQFAGAFEFDGDTHVELASTPDLDRTNKFSYGAWVYPTAGGAMTVLSRMDDDAKFRGWDLYLGDGKAFVHLVHEWEGNAIRVNAKNAVPQKQWSHLFVTYDGSSKAKGVKVYVNGQPAEMEVTHDKLSGTIWTDKPARIGRRTPGAPFRGLIDEVRIYDRELAPAEVSHLAGFMLLRPILATPAVKRDDKQKETLKKYYLDNVDEPHKKLSAALAEARKMRDDHDNAIPTTMVMKELDKPRETRVLLRGMYDQKGEKVSPGTPGFLPAMPPGAARNRLGLAQWLVDPQHPLTSRVAVNHLWQMLFGTGLVKTSEDFGVQGERPSHPELLDWLATEYMRTGWDTKAMVRMIVTSSAYRQSSKLTPELREKDPENRLLARGPRVRLPAEFIRDQALAVSGLLGEKIGGPSVRPYQPAGLWEEISFKGGFTAQFYEQDKGEALYRRSMYTFWKRTVPPPSLQTFDAPEREFCIVRRSVTNTPLQALVLMNDPTYVEAARKLAERLLVEAEGAPRNPAVMGESEPVAAVKDRLRYAFRLVLSREPADEEMSVLLGLYNQEMLRFNKDREGAKKLLAVGESKRNERLDPVELATWTTVASTLLNLDEAITKS
ncbi:MAG: DUF1553 domain-containing protein [Armatimonadetes bacterium]|nr:DUF1553 domain-containing protein [Armatimonadota bacterium]